VTAPDSAHWSFDAVVEAHGAAISRYAWAFVDNGDDHADLMQDLLVALWRALPRFRGESSLRTYVYRIVHNRALSYAAARRRHVGVELSDELPDYTPGPDAQVDADLCRLRLLRAIRQLEPTLRQAVLLHLEGTSTEEIAHIQGVSVNNAAVRLSRGRHALRSTMGER
jgi:RNA polymerase sigma-70 factor (ECF subfamily)